MLSSRRSQAQLHSLGPICTKKTHTESKAVGLAKVVQLTVSFRGVIYRLCASRKQLQVWFHHLEHILNIINPIIKQKSLNGYITVKMSDWEPCESCKPDDDHSSDVISLCADCQQNRMTQLFDPILKDRAYRAHLARRVLGLPCLEQCPEGPKGHATCVWDTLNLVKEQEVQAYGVMMKFIFKQFERPWSGYHVTAFEILVGQHEVEGIEYCSECLTKAREKLELNVPIRLCESCLTMRDAHIQHTFQSQLHYCEPWERYNVRWMSYYEFEDGYKDMGYDSFVEFYLEETGGGDTIAIVAASLAGALGVSAFFQKLLFDLFAKSHNDGMYSVTVQHNDRMFQETHLNNLRMERIATLQYNLAMKQYFETRKNTAEGSEPIAAEDPVILDPSTTNAEREPIPAEERLRDLMQIRYEQALAQEALAPEIRGAVEHILEGRTTLKELAELQAEVALRHHVLTKLEGPNKASDGGESSA